MHCEQLSIERSVVDIDDPTPPEALPFTVRTFVRPLHRFPPNFEARVSMNGKGVITPVKHERILKNLLGRCSCGHGSLVIHLASIVTIYKADPDVIVGHAFLGVSPDVTLHRMRELKADH